MGLPKPLKNAILHKHGSWKNLLKGILYNTKEEIQVLAPKLNKNKYFKGYNTLHLG